MVTGLVVPHDISKTLHTAEFNALIDYQAAVGGSIETVRVNNNPLVIIADEDGKLKRRPVNRRATILWWLLNPAELGGEELVGDVLLVGTGQRGEPTKALSNLVSLILEPKQYEVQVLMSRSSDTWVAIGPTVDNFFEAAVRALGLMRVWNPPAEVKVVGV